MKRRTIQQIDRSDLGELLFEIDEAQFCRQICSSARHRLRRLTARVRGVVAEQRGLARQIKAMNHVLFHREGFRYGRHPREEVITLTGTLHRGQGSCLGLTAVYYILAQAAGLAVYPLMYEGHMAVCHTATNPPRHIEVSRKGAVLPARVMVKLLDLSNGQSVVLDQHRFLAVYLSNQAAFVLAKRGRVEEALTVLDWSIELFPEYAGAWINRASILLGLGEKEYARASADRALSLSIAGHFKETADEIRAVLGGAQEARR